MDETDVIYKDIPGFEGYYQVSNTGIVRSLDRISEGFSHGKRVPMKVKGQVFRGRDNKGYRFVTLRKDGKRFDIGIHQLVMRTFVGTQEPGMEVRHLDNNPSNNRLDNLAYGTKSDNMRDAVEAGTLVFSRTSLTREDVIAIAKDTRRIGVIAKDYGILESVVIAIKNGRAFKSVAKEVYYKKRQKRELTDEELAIVHDRNISRAEVMSRLGLTLEQVKYLRHTNNRIVYC